MKRRASTVLHAISADKILIGGAAVTPEFVRERFNKGTRVYCVGVLPHKQDYQKLHALKSRLRGTGSSVSHTWDGASKVYETMSNWDFDFYGDVESCFWYVMTQFSSFEIPSSHPFKERQEVSRER